MAAVTDLDLSASMRSIGPASQHLEAVVTQVKTAMHGQITVANVILFITYTMQTVQQIEGLSGPDKKRLAHEALQHVLAELPVSEEDRETLRIAITTLAPNIIDALVAAAKGQFNFGKIAQRVRAFWGRCC